MMVIVPVPWSERVWALPFLTLLAPSEASNRKNGIFFYECQKKSDPLGKFQPTAFFSTNLAFSPQQILACFILRWSLEVTFQEAHAHLGLETQRQWSDLAIQRTTPALLALFSLITLIAFRLTTDQAHPLLARHSAWYVKAQPTFSDVIAFVRFFLWKHLKFTYSPVKSGLGLFPDSLLRGLVDSLCYFS
jgi:hypothetical protein